MPELTPQQKAQLDKNIKAMLAQGASEDDVMSYATDFRNKYDVKKKEPSPVSGVGLLVGGQVGTSAAPSEEGKAPFAGAAKNIGIIRGESISDLHQKVANHSLLKKLPKDKADEVLTAIEFNYDILPNATGHAEKIDGEYYYAGKKLTARADWTQEQNDIYDKLEKLFDNSAFQLHTINSIGRHGAESAAPSVGGYIPPIIKTKVQEAAENNKKRALESVSEYVSGLKTPEQKALAKESQVASAEHAYSIGQNRLKDYMVSDSPDPLGDIKMNARSKTDADDIVKDFMAAKTLEDFTTGFDAKQALASKTFTGDTKKLLQSKADNYEKVAAPFRGIQFMYGNTPTDNPESDYTAKDKLYNAAILAYSNKYPHFKGQLLAAGIDPNNPDLKNAVGAKAGIIMGEMLGDEDFANFIYQERPELRKTVEGISQNLLVDNPEFGINTVSNEISRERQRLGFNNPIVEFDDKRFRDETDLVAEKLYGGGKEPVKMRIYQEQIKPNPDKYIDTPNFLESFAHGAEGVYRGIGSTFSSPLSSIPSLVKEGWDKETSQVSAEAKGINKFLSGTGHVLGLVAALGGTSAVLGGGKVAQLISGTVPFAGDIWKESVMKYPNQPDKALASTFIQTALYGALSQHIFPAKQAKAAFEKVKPELANIVENLATKKITEEAARRQTQSLFKDAVNLIGGGVGKAAKISAELTGIQAINRVYDRLNLDKETFEQYHQDSELADIFGSMFLDNLVLGGMTKYGAMKRGNAIVEQSLYEAATNPKRYERVINEMEVKDPSISKDQMLANLSFLSGAKKELDAAGVEPKNQPRYLFEAAKERALLQQRNGSPESNIQRKHEEEIKRGQEIKQRILDGENADEIITESEQKEIDEADKVNTEIERLTKQNELDNQEYEAKRKELDGRNPDDRLKIARLDQAIKEKNEDYQKKINKLSPPKIDQVREIDMGVEQITEPVELNPNLPEGYELKKSDNELLAAVREKTPDDLKNNDLNFFVEQAASAPSRFVELYGEDLTNELLSRASTELIERELNLVKNFEGHKSIPLLEKELSKRLKQQENAVQVKSPNEVDVRQQATNGEGMGEGNAKPEIAAKETKGEEEAVVKVKAATKPEFELEDLSEDDFKGVSSFKTGEIGTKRARLVRDYERLKQLIDCIWT